VREIKRLLEEFIVEVDNIKATPENPFDLDRYTITSPDKEFKNQSKMI